MDAITQGLLGAAATQAVLGHRLGKRAWLYGAIGGMAPDLDIFIRSTTDPLVGWRFHRHFTHSLAFIPIGGPLSALPWLVPDWIRRRDPQVPHRDLIAATTVGYATHALLDALTSYGTQLWWPFANIRVAWNWVAIVDPIYTLTLLLGVILATRRRSPRPARTALLLSSLYLAFGGLQWSRAIEATRNLAAHRGHTEEVIERIDAFPNPFGDIVWRTAYVANGRIWIDQARTPWLVSPARAIAGDSVPLLRWEDLPAEIRNNPRTAEGFEVFRWFADGWVAWDPAAPGVISDQRYGVDTAGTASMWGIKLVPGVAQPVQAYRAPNMGNALGRRWRNLMGEDE